MRRQIDYNDPRYAHSAGEILRRQAGGEPEANITSAVRDFLTLTGLVEADQIVEENPPAHGSRRAVDLAALDTFIEFKTTIGAAGGFDPNPEYVQQLDDYLAESERQGRSRMGILTDGRYWLLRWPGAGPVRTFQPYGFELESAERWLALYAWLRDHALSAEEGIPPTRATIEERFGPNAAAYEREITSLRTLYAVAAHDGTVAVKRQLWENLLTAALGELAAAPEELDDLFVRHTYLSGVIGMVAQASFGGDIRRLADEDPADLLLGRDFRSKTGLQGVVESDFFAWPAEVGGLPLLSEMARRVARFDWRQAPTDVAAILYQTVIPPDERRQLGEYYTPDWLARAVIGEVVTDPLHQRVLDPACGSGSFLSEAVARFIEAAQADASLTPTEALERLRNSVSGIDVHPVAVHLARVAWALAAQPAIEDVVADGFGSDISIPVYLGDALQLRHRPGDLFAQRYVTIQVEGERGADLVFPVSLVDRAEKFDALTGEVAEAIERGDDPTLALDDHAIADPDERETLETTIAAMRRLHDEGRDHIWAYYTRNLVRPVALSRNKVDAIVGNPPWINYNQTVNTLRSELRRLSEDVYGIWAGGRYATHQDVAGLFFARAADLYLREGGAIGMVMPHSALQTGQYAKWRSGAWSRGIAGGAQPLNVDFRYRTAWDLERLEPNTFFPVPACVVFARRLGAEDAATPLAGVVERWHGKAGAANVRRTRAAITDTSEAGDSPYAGRARNGATIFPRCLFFVEETENRAIVRAGQTITVNPRRGAYDKNPWKSLDLSAISERTVETAHAFDVHLGETVAPYVALDPLRAALPLRRGEYELPTDADGVGGVRLGGLNRRMRDRWRTVSGLWETNKAAANRMNLVQQLNYFGKLSSQLEWQRDAGDKPFRVVYTGSGAPTAAIVRDPRTIVDHKLFWIACADTREARYLLAIVNSDALFAAVERFMSRGQFGARDLHKHLWKLSIPEFDGGDALHAAIADAGEAAASGAARRLAEIRRDRGGVGVIVVRRELRAWLRASAEGRAVEEAVGKLLG